MRLKRKFIPIKNNRQINMMRRSGIIARDILLRTAKVITKGVSTKFIDDFASKLIKEYKCKSAFLNYRGFSGNICISVNEEVIHGIGNETKIVKEGDIVKIDVGIIKNGWVGDNAISVPVGEISKSVKKLLYVTEEALDFAIGLAKDGQRLGTLCASIDLFAKKNQCSVVKDFVGHGVGKKLHEEPAVPNFGVENTGPRLKNGMILAIEPMINLGSPEVKILDDNWTVVTIDGKPSAHFEHTVLVSTNKGEILTPRNRLTKLNQNSGEIEINSYQSPNYIY